MKALTAGKKSDRKMDAAAKSAAVEYLNVGLMIGALALAAVIPLELFLFSYAVLGPLHYLTEISWLHDRRYFAVRRMDWLPLVVCAVLITLGNSGVIGPSGTALINRLHLAGYGLADALHACYWDLTFIAFAAALIFILTGSLLARLLGLAIAALVAALFHLSSLAGASGVYFKIFAVYLPSLIHVFVFTGAFILLGALKRQSSPGYASLLVFLICGGLSVWLPNLAAGARPWAAEVFWRGFQDLSAFSLEDIMGYRVEQGVGANILPLVRFFAFAYTYHYLNWFSKTSIIQWHAVSPLRLAMIAVLWFASVALYAVNYDLGLRWLFLLSLCHVVLEFPLNHKSFIEIAAELRKRVTYAA